MKLKQLIKNLQISGRVVIRWIDENASDKYIWEDEEWYFDVTQIPKEYGLCEIIRAYAINPVGCDSAICIELKKDW